VCTLRYDERYQTSDKMIGNVIYPADSDQLDRGMEYLPDIYMKEYSICTQEIRTVSIIAIQSGNAIDVWAYSDVSLCNDCVLMNEI
jgi:hypothetical protein